MRGRADAEGRERFAELDGLRALAAFTVFWGHAAYAWFPLEPSFRLHLASRLAPVGVAIFFCVSGFVLYRPFVMRRAAGAPPLALRRYAIRRIARIVPAYWVALTALAIFPGLNLVFSDQWYVYYGFAQIYTEKWAVGGLGQAWTLNVEILFYASLPLFAWAMRRRGAGSGAANGVRRELWALAALTALSLALRAWDFTNGGTTARPVANSLLGTFGWFTLGMALAIVTAGVVGGRWSTRLRALAERPLVCLGLAAALFGGLLTSRSYDPAAAQTVWRVVLEFEAIAAIAALLVLPAVLGSRPVTRRVLGNRVAVWLGTVSYGIYLWHMPLAEFFSTWEPVTTFPSPVVAFTAVTVGVVVALAALSFYLIERPLLRRTGSLASRDRRARRRRARSPLPVPVRPAPEQAG